ncbi:transglutaminase family protein [Phormidium sp. CCY1219]|uniref:transglutaminase family protein n=1 Tax=Phormidium sp. CCY1219 TaxID=2886104 RepID=UPI002D1E9C34|nr:transglutaminase family protein [Phormidium sp. CCY1219]MEB3831553.1 transglutaminase family protein [Phormidium sp. CCY1219]
MSIKVALNHRKVYRFDRAVTLGPHTVRLRPSPHCRTSIHSYSLQIAPENHALYWRQDIWGNWLARANFPEKTEVLKFEVDLIAELQPINPFDFLVENYAASYPFAYPEDIAKELAPCLQVRESGPLLKQWLEPVKAQSSFITTFLGAIAQKIQQCIAYKIRLEEGIQSCEETLEKREGSCRDTAWLLVQILRHCGLAARFVSGYLIQLVPEEPAPDEPRKITTDTADLHAWAEVYLPGAGWIGLDPTSGMFAAEGHVPLACAADPRHAEPIAGTISACESTLEFAVRVSRFAAPEPGTAPYTSSQWQAIQRLGERVDERLHAAEVRLTMGGEPTFIALDDRESVQWRTGALGEEKRARAGILLEQLRDRFAPGGLLHYGQGKWYPGEPLPRWALGCYWRKDGLPIWRDRALMARDAKDYGYSHAEAAKFLTEIAQRLGVAPDCAIAAYEDTADSEIAAYALPLIWVSHNGKEGWRSCLWEPPRDRLVLIPGDSPAGYRLPLDRMSWVPDSELQTEAPLHPDASKQPLGDMAARVAARSESLSEKQSQHRTAANSIQVALCVQVREGCLQVFIPPINRADSYLDLIACIEDTAAATGYPVRIEGYAPPRDRRLQGFQITPDPGVIEVNLHPAHSWEELVRTTTTLYEDARECRLGTEKYTTEGDRIGTGGGSHITLGGVTPEESPLLRRPDLLRSLITYWQNHPSLSYLFSGLFVGATSQAPRVDEARHESLYELEIAFSQLTRDRATPAGGPGAENPLPPEVVDRLLRNLLIDVTGNTHRCEFCLDKLYPVENPRNQVGLLELRGFEMPPHPEMALVLSLLIRALVARFWQQPYTHKLVRWGTQLHDRFLLPHYVYADIGDVVRELHDAGYPFELEWFAPFLDFRFPRYGEILRDGVQLELRRAIEPWYVLGEEASRRGTARYVDSSMERLQVLLRGATEGRHIVTCNGYPVPLQSTEVAGVFVAGVRYRARKIAACLHPAIDPHVPLRFDIVDTWANRAIGGCTYYAQHPRGEEWADLPVNQREAQTRLAARFVPEGHTHGTLQVPSLPPSREYPLTLDLRRV